jgi:dimethylhistidine N-methyltransferase
LLETTERAVRERVTLHDLKPQLTDVREEVHAGLVSAPRRLSPKYFYDERGSELFEAITRLPEYYPTRTEMSILQQRLPEICQLLGRETQLVEYGSGSSRKIRLLLDGLRPSVYMPIDISLDHLRDAALRLAEDYPSLEIHAVCADYSRPFVLPWRDPSLTVSAFFPGSSIGNFERGAAALFLAHVHETLGVGSRLLVGVDRRKDAARLEAAYDDAEGVTAAFNRNALVHLRRVLGGDVEPERFDHLAFYDASAGRIEMHLVAREDQVFRLGNTEVVLEAGDRIHTENSYKYDPEEFEALARGAGFETLRHWTDVEELFSVFVLETV